MQVVGCTGLVNGVTKVMATWLRNQDMDILGINLKLSKEKYLAQICNAYKGNLVMAVATVPSVELSTAIDSGYKCPDIQITTDTAGTAAIKEGNAILTEKEKREACFNGLAYTLAKNQLTSMTRETLNWINTGFNGNPLYVQNIRSLTNSIERNVIETGIQVLANGVFPYSGDFNRTIIQSYNGGAMNGAENFLLSLQSDLSAFLTDKDSYGLGNTNQTLNAKARAINDNNRFANDFSVGGWDGWMALTQRENNNPLGFTMQAAQYLADRIDQQAGETKDEISQGGGFMSQKECITYNDEELIDLNKERDSVTEAAAIQCEDETVDYNDGAESDCEYSLAALDMLDSRISSFVRKCTNWRVTTPGSIIKEKLSAYINSPERQLEMADTINKSLSSLFTKLIENFRSEGLFGLSQDKYSAVDNMIGYGVNGTGIDGTIGSGYSSPIYSSGYSDNSFNLTRDLGNTYIHDPVRSLGTWDAKTNMTSGGESLNVDLGVYNEISSGYESPNYYFTVTDIGNTKLYDNGYNGWAIGDRAFWNGTEWQNWKKGQVSPIAKRGIIQTQTDYVIAAKEILKVIPNIMTKVGELDYCIPGPNPNFEANSADASTAFNDLVGSISGKWDQGSFFVRNSTTFSIADKGTEIYSTYANIFKGVPSLFDQTYTLSNKTSPIETIQSTQPWKNIHSDSIIGKTFKSNATEGVISATVTKIITNIQKEIRDFYPSYKKQIFDVRFGTMRDEFLETESSSEITKNDAYVPMIEEGYAATKDMVAKNQDLLDEAQGYRDAIVLAELNTSKLNDIKSKVSAIIKAAQDRRNNNSAFRDKIQEYFRKEKGNPLLTMDAALIWYNQYKIDNKSCFNEEDLSFFDEGDTVVDTTIEAERCNDGLDNDMDGLVDGKDPDCKLSMSITSDKETVVSGGNIMLDWSAPSATKCDLSDGITKEFNIGTSGSRQKTITKTTNFTLLCTLEGAETWKNVVVNLMKAPATPNNLSVDAGLCNTGKIYVSFNPSAGASNYQVYRDGSTRGSGTKIYDGVSNGGQNSGLIYDIVEIVSANSSASRSAGHTYTVKACNEAGCSALSSASAGVQALACNFGVYYSAGPGGSLSVKNENGIYVNKITTWDSTDKPEKGNDVMAVPNAGYVFDYWSKSSSGKGNWANDGWTSATRTDADLGYITEKMAVRAYFKQLVPVSPTLTITPSASCAANGTYYINLSWTASPGAIGYSVYKKIGTGTPSLLPATIYTTYKDTGLTPGGTYSYMVNAFNSDGGTSTAQLKEITLPACTYTLTYLSNDSAMGVISGKKIQTLAPGQSGEAVYAGANTGYRFSKWNDSQIKNPRTDVGVVGDRSFTATFIKQ